MPNRHINYELTEPGAGRRENSRQLNTRSHQYQGPTLHQLRHSAPQHLTADGRTAPELQAKSRHLHLGSLGRYVQLGEQTSAKVTADADPAARRRTR
jgi:hypothetical protein